MALFIVLPLDLRAAVDGSNGVYRDPVTVETIAYSAPRPANVAGNSEPGNERSITLPFEIPRYKGHDLERISRQFGSNFGSTRFICYSYAGEGSKILITGYRFENNFVRPSK